MSSSKVPEGMTPERWNREYQNVPIIVDVYECPRCKAMQKKSDMVHDWSIEINHPLNRGLWSGHPDLHETTFLRCGNPAGRRDRPCHYLLFADGRWVGKR